MTADQTEPFMVLVSPDKTEPEAVVVHRPTGATRVVFRGDLAEQSARAAAERLNRGEEI